MTVLQMNGAGAGASRETPEKRRAALLAEDLTPDKVERPKRSLCSVLKWTQEKDAKKRCLEAPSTSPESPVKAAVAPVVKGPREPSLSPGKRAVLSISAAGTTSVVSKPTPGYEPVELRRQLSEHDVPPESSELLLPLLQRWGPLRLQQVLSLWKFFGEGAQGIQPCNLQRRSGNTLHVWGPRGTGKSGLVEDYLQKMRFEYVKLNARGFANQLEAHQQLVRSLTMVAIKRQRAAKSEIESLDPAAVPKHLRQLDRLEVALDVPLATLDRLGVSKVIIILDNVEELCRRIGMAGLQLLVSLPEALPRRGSMLSVVLIGRDSVSRFNPMVQPEDLFFPAYSEAELQVLLPHLLSQKYPHIVGSLGDADHLASNVVAMTVLLQFVPIIGSDLGLLLAVGSDVVEKLPTLSGDFASANGAASGRELKKNPSLGETTERINDLVLEACRGRVDLKPFAGQASNPEARADAVVVQMTKAEKELLLAAYLGSYLSQKDDRRLFLGVASRRRVTVRKKKEEHDTPCWVKAPHSMPLMRLLAIYHKLALARTSMLLGNHFWLTLTSLKEAGFIRISNERGLRVDRDMKVICLASLYVARACAIHLDIDLAEYLC